VNDNAIVYTSDLEPGKYTVNFWYHAKGEPGGLTVSTRASGSEFTNRIWSYSMSFNGEQPVWTEVTVQIDRESSFRVSAI